MCNYVDLNYKTKPQKKKNTLNKQKDNMKKNQ